MYRRLVSKEIRQLHITNIKHDKPKHSTLRNLAKKRLEFEHCQNVHLTVMSVIVTVHRTIGV